MPTLVTMCDMGKTRKLENIFENRDLQIKLMRMPISSADIANVIVH